jgi:hypothetical protein
MCISISAWGILSDPIGWWIQIRSVQNCFPGSGHFSEKQFILGNAKFQARTAVITFIQYCL